MLHRFNVIKGGNFLILNSACFFSGANELEWNDHLIQLNAGFVGLLGKWINGDY